MRSNARIRLAIGLWALCVAHSAVAQSNLEKGKTGAQLYASDCASCHKSPQSVMNAPGIFGLESFLREHYTASRESAAAIVAYLNGLKPSTGRAAKRTGRGMPLQPTANKSKDGVPRPPADIKAEESNHSR